MESEHSTQQNTLPRPRLERLRGDRAVAGVASGLARYLGIDVAWVRIAFVLAAIFGGTGVLLYLVGWIAMPEEGKGESIGADKVRDLQGSGSWIGMGLIVLAGIIIVGNSGIVDGELVFAGVLVAFGVMLYRGDIGNSTDADTSADPVSTTQSYEAETYQTSAPLVSPGDLEPQIYGQVSTEPVSPPLDPDPAFQARPVAPRESSPLGRITMAFLLIAMGIIGIGHSSGWFEPSLRHYVAWAFVVLGAGLLVGSFFGRARWLIIIGLALTPFLIGASLLRVPFEGGFGDPHFTPQTATEIDSEYRLIAGELVLDLSSLQLADGEVFEVEASVVFGRFEVIVPPDLGVDVTARLDVGEMNLDGEVTSGVFNMEDTISFDGSGLIELDAQVGFGELVIREATP